MGQGHDCGDDLHPVNPRSPAMRVGQIIARGFAAAHGALVGALYVFLLQAPLQVLSALTQGFQPQMTPAPGQQPDAKQLVLSVAFSCGTFVLALAVFFLFPLVQGGILGQVRDRLESPQQPPGPFAPYGRAFYRRLLGSQALFTLLMFVALLPLMGLTVGLYFQVQEMGSAAPADPQQLNRQLLSYPVMVVCMVIFAVLAAAVGMVYWVANTIVVAEKERVFASWRQALHFCRQNFAAVLAVWLLNFAAGLLMSPLALVGQRGVVKEPWALVGLAVVYSALIGYWSVLLAGLMMSLYLARRSPSERPEPEPAALA
jgi:hypothetical protein